MLELFITLVDGTTRELQIDKASLLETFGSLKIRNFGYTPSCLQLLFVKHLFRRTPLRSNPPRVALLKKCSVNMLQVCKASFKKNNFGKRHKKIF